MAPGHCGENTAQLTRLKTMNTHDHDGDTGPRIPGTDNIKDSHRSTAVHGAAVNRRTSPGTREMNNRTGPTGARTFRTIRDHITRRGTVHTNGHQRVKHLRGPGRHSTRRQAKSPSANLAHQRRRGLSSPRPAAPRAAVLNTLGFFCQMRTRGVFPYLLSCIVLYHLPMSRRVSSVGRALDL